MTVDGIAIVLLGILSYLGWRTGALGQVLRIAAAVVALVYGRVASTFVREILFGSSDIAAPVVEVTSYFLGASLLYAAVVLVGWFVIRTMRAATPTLATMDRAGGASLGAIKAAVLIYVMLAGTLLMMVPLETKDPEDRLHLRDGYLTAFAGEYDIFSPWQIEELDTLHRFLRAGLKARENGIEHLLRKHEAAADLLRRDPVRKLIEDDAMKPAIESGEETKTLADERIRDLLNDPRFMDQLRKLDLDAIEGTLKQETPAEKGATGS